MNAPTERRAFIAFITIVCLGVFFRLFHADWKLYSFDETATSMRASGHTFAEFRQFAHDGRTHDLREIERYQVAGASTGPIAVWNSLAAEDPQHPPIYFMLTSYVGKYLPDSLFVRRLPAIIFGIIGLATAWFLAIELFRDHLIAWCFTSLVAVAPFHVVYAQQAREYSLWMMLITLSSSILLRALRTGRSSWYIAYSASVALGLWSFTLFVLTAIAHLAYVAMPTAGFTLRRRVGAGIALAAAAVSFVPWLIVLGHQTKTAFADTTWSAMPLSWPLFLGKWIFNASSVFFDLDYLSLFFLPLSLFLLAMAAWCTWLFFKHTPKRTWSFVALLGAVDLAAFLPSDILLHQTHSVQSRYLTPLWLSLELTTAYGIVYCWRLLRSRPRRVYEGAAAVVFGAGILSCAVSSFAHSWWLANNDKTLPAISEVLANQKSPTIVYADDEDELLELAASRKVSAAFHLHSDLNASAFEHSPNPFALARQADIRQSMVSRLHSIELPAVFPSRQDPVIAMLRRRASADRHDDTSGDIKLLDVANANQVTGMHTQHPGEVVSY